MTTNSRRIDYVKVLRLKQVGIALAALWVVIFIAAVSATIYREFDGPTVRSTTAENMDLSSINSALNQDLILLNQDLILVRTANDDALENLSAANVTIDRLNIDLRVSRSDHFILQKRLESYLTLVPLTPISR